jgi:truncated hemoglobin YjbI
MIGDDEHDERDESLFDLLGGRATLDRVHVAFYDKLYADPWLSQFFVGIERAFIEDQQGDFMAQCMGGPQRYMGRAPPYAHQHMFITEELFDLRHSMLEASLRECGVPDALRARWLKIDRAFKRRLVKASPADCQGRYRTEPVMVIRKP